jgi:hypothetical protein
MAAFGQAPVKTGRLAGMAGGTLLFHKQDEGILVAVDQDLMHFLHVSRCFAFHPQFTARAAPVRRMAGFDRLLQAFPVHVCLHENFACAEILRNGRHQTLVVEFHILQKFQIHIQGVRS